jgi:hypothetical protein
VIQASDLKVNNWVKRNDMDGVFTVRSISLDQLQHIALIDHDYEKNVHYACECTLSELEPIKISEDMLIQSGFEWDGEYYSHPVLSEKFVIYEGENADEYRIHFTHRKYVSLYYLHQLQNIYYYLTGQELQIKINNHE